MAIAPTYPECDENDLRATLQAVAALEPVTIFHEPINIRAENVKRINAHAESLGIELNTEVFSAPDRWQDYAVNSLKMVERLAEELGISDRLHLWPDPALGNASAVKRTANPQEYLRWLNKWWGRISEWPM